MTLLKWNTDWQKKLASWIGKKSEGISITGKKLMLLCLMLIGGGYCFYKIINVFKDNEAYTSISVSHTKVLQHVSANEGVTIDKVPPVSKKTYEKIHRFHLYLDSLAIDPSGHAIYNSMIRSHPGLLDSILIIEKLYQSQSKK